MAFRSPLSRFAGSINSGTQKSTESPIPVTTPGRQTEIGAERRERRVGRSDGGNRRRRRPDAAQIDEVDVQNLAEEFPVRCEATLPEARADNDLEPPPLWIIRTERSALQRYAENFEDLRRDAEPAQAFASISPGKIHSLSPIAGDGFERFRLSLPVEQIGRRNRGKEHVVGRIHRA